MAKTLPHNLVATTSICITRQYKKSNRPTQPLHKWLVHDCLPAETPGAPLWATHETWIASIDDRPRIHVYTITYLQKIEPECRFVGLLRHLGDHQSFLGEKYRYRHVWF